MTVIDFGTVTNSNKLKTANMRKAKKLDRLRAIDERENLKDLAERKKENFFSLREDKNKEPNLNLKRIRDADKNSNQEDILKEV